ncbi:MAG: Gfo/Idh/MocA family oxidoreductase, partial [Kiloniellales bacterium]|nr:Gfo/Idh/MocA family oxidoreductase [Kiloniellales bacterium]
GNLFEYGQAEDLRIEDTQSRVLRDTALSADPTTGRRAKPVRLGAIGAGNYASSMLFPQLKKDSRVTLARVATASALSAANASRKFGFMRQSTDYGDLLADDEIDGVVIATRHKAHAPMVAEALRAGKAVFVEKPLAIDEQGIELVRKSADESGNVDVMVGFNRRFSPIMRDLKSKVAAGPLQLLYRVQAGSLGPSSWLADREEGSRFIGEAGHFLDVFDYLVEAPPLSVCGAVLRPEKALPDDLENISVMIRYADGSLATLLYVTQGGSSTPKERLEVFAAGETLIMDNFAALVHHTADGKTLTRKGYGGNKGQSEEMRTFVSYLAGESPLPVKFDAVLAMARLTLFAEEAALAQKVISLR